MICTLVEISKYVLCVFVILLVLWVQILPYYLYYDSKDKIWVILGVLVNVFSIALVIASIGEQVCK